MQMTLDLPTAPTPQDWQTEVLTLARATIDLNQKPGYAAFTNGTVNTSHIDTDHIVMTTGSRWAASAIRAALQDAGHAVDADPDNQAATVVAWKIHHRHTSDAPHLAMDASDADHPISPGFSLHGPDGSVEQQCGAGGHNNLIAHAPHPFPGASRGPCARHTGPCWQRYCWPHMIRVRHLLASGYTPSGAAEWRMTPAAEQRMQRIYMTYIHTTRR